MTTSFDATRKIWFVNVDTGTAFNFDADGNTVTIDPECTSIRYRLGLPREMLLYINESIDGTASTWFVYGILSAKNVSEANPVRWESETFRIIDDIPILPPND